MRSATAILLPLLLAGLAAVPAGAAPEPIVVSGGEGEKALHAFATSIADQAERAEKGSRRAREFAAIALEELARYDRLYPEGRFLDDVHYRMARAELDLGREGRAAARLLEVRIVDAGAAREAVAGEELDRLLGTHRGLKAIAGRYRQALERYRDPAAAAAARRLGFVRALFLVDHAEARAIVAGEAESYIERFGGTAESIEVALALADLERRRGEPRRAVVGYERVRFLNPASPLVPRALLAEGQVLDEDLAEHVAAIAAYQQVVREWESAGEAGTAWLLMARVERRGLKRPEIALRDLDEVLKRYPDHPDAFAAVLEKAAIQAEDLADGEGAEETLLAGVARYPHNARAPEALERAAELAEKRRKDLPGAAGRLERLARDYPDYRGAAEALFHAAEIHERSGDRSRAAGLYRETARLFPASQFAERAAKRAERLDPPRERNGS